MGKRTPTSPVASYHRLMRMMVAVNHGGENLQPTPEELDRIAKVFAKAGGSWEKVFLGGIDDNHLLKTTIKVAVKEGLISKAPTWG